MKKIIALIIFYFLACHVSFAQTDNFLMAKKDKRTILFHKDEAVKVIYNNGDVSQELRGRINRISDNSITVKSFKGRETTEIQLGNLEGIRKLNRTGKIIAGVLGGFGVAVGMSLIVEDESEQDEFLDGLGTAVGTTMIFISSAPYVLLAATPGEHTTSKGFKFYVAKRKTGN